MHTELAPPPATTDRRPGWLLALSPLGFVAVIATGAATFVSAGIDEISQLSPADMAEIRVGFVGYAVVYAAALALGGTGLWLLDRSLRDTPGRRAATAARAVLVLLGAVLVAHVVLAGALTGFTEPRLELAALAGPNELLSKLAVWTAGAATALTAFALRSAGRLRRTGLVVGVLGAAYVAVDVVLGGAFPPFVVAFGWLAIGVGLLRRRVPSRG